MKLGEEGMEHWGVGKIIVVGDQYTLYKCIQLSKKRNMFLRSPSLGLLIEPFL